MEVIALPDSLMRLVIIIIQHTEIPCALVYVESTIEPNHFVLGVLLSITFFMIMIYYWYIITFELWFTYDLTSRNK